MVYFKMMRTKFILLIFFLIFVKANVNLNEQFHKNGVVRNI